MQNIKDVRDPVVGQVYLTTCYVRTLENGDKQYTPIIDHPHSDRENGQKEIHYHCDSRFSYHPDCALHVLANYEWKSHFRMEPNENTTIELLPCIMTDTRYGGISPVSTISKSTLKHDCAHKNKCPHRGFDLTDIKPNENGEIVCPLHGLRFRLEEGTMKLVPVVQYLDTYD